MSIPSLAACVCAILCGRLTLTVSSKKLALFGLSAYMIGGAGCGLIANIYWMLGCRFLLGVGAGFCIPLTQGLIAQYYDGKQRASMMGYAQSIGSAGGSIVSLAAGYIALTSWRSTFLLYLFPVIVIILIAKMLPDTKPESRIAETKEPVGESSKEKRNMHPGIYVFAVVGFIMMALYLNILINISSLISTENLGNSAQAGIAVSLNSISMVVSALLFGKLFKVFKVHLCAGCFVIFCIACLLIATASNIYMVYAGMFIYGLGAGLLLPVLGMAVSALAVKAYRSFALSILNASMNLGAFSASIAMGIIFAVVGVNNLKGLFTALAVVFIVLAVVMAFFVLPIQKKVLENLQQD